jgi:sulfofructose kinase
MPEMSPLVDVVGVGLNATDTIIRIPHFPAFNSKVEFRSAEVLPGGQVASAMVACTKWGLATRYVGKIGDDDAGQLQRREMQLAGVEAHWVVVPNCRSQTAFILVDEASGERTILWKRDPRLELLPLEICRKWVLRSKLLHVDGHDCKAAAAAASWAREAGIPVLGDLDNVYPEVEAILHNVDYLIASRDFPCRKTGEPNLLNSLPEVARRFGCRVTAATLGADGVLAWDGIKFLYAPAFAVDTVDTTGAGDIFHAGFAYTLIQGYPLSQALEFSCAAAALSCMAPGARGGIATLDEIDRLLRTGDRHPPAFSQEQLESLGAGR